ncbi:MAG TPA: hypothetical protein VFV86_03240 [Nitrososphaeraceae archaeon]|nr:hypothetical protein [Nitrososphaeraceae archaeon]
MIDSSSSSNNYYDNGIGLAVSNFGSIPLTIGSTSSQAFCLKRLI